MPRYRLSEPAMASGFLIESSRGRTRPQSVSDQTSPSLMREEAQARQTGSEVELRRFVKGRG